LVDGQGSTALAGENGLSKPHGTKEESSLGPFSQQGTQR